MRRAAHCHPAAIHRRLSEPILTPTGGETACPRVETNQMAHPRVLRSWLDERGVVVLPKSRKAVDGYFQSVGMRSHLVAAKGIVSCH